MTEETCAFCRIVRGEDPSTRIICEGGNWVAFFPSEPATPGHILVVPREHVVDLWSLDSALGADLIGAVVKVGRAVRTAVTPSGMNLISSAGAAAEQTVFHLHLHIVPRYQGDDIEPLWPQKKHLDEKLKEDIAERIRQACASSQLLQVPAAIRTAPTTKMTP